MAPTCFGLRPSSGSLQLSLAEVILILRHSVKLRRYLLCGGVAACPGMACVFCAVLCTAHNTHGQPSELFLSGLKKLEFGRRNLFPSWSG